MGRSTKDITSKVLNTGKDAFSGQMVQFIKVNFKKTELKVSEPMSGQMEEFTKDNGKIIR